MRENRILSVGHGRYQDKIPDGKNRKPGMDSINIDPLRGNGIECETLNMVADKNKYFFKIHYGRIFNGFIFANMFMKSKCFYLLMMRCIIPSNNAFSLGILLVKRIFAFAVGEQVILCKKCTTILQRYFDHNFVIRSKIIVINNFIGRNER